MMQKINKKANTPLAILLLFFLSMIVFTYTLFTINSEILKLRESVKKNMIEPVYAIEEQINYHLVEGATQQQILDEFSSQGVSLENGNLVITKIYNTTEAPSSQSRLGAIGNLWNGLTNSRREIQMANITYKKRINSAVTTPTVLTTPVIAACANILGTADNTVPCRCGTATCTSPNIRCTATTNTCSLAPLH